MELPRGSLQSFRQKLQFLAVSVELGVYSQAAIYVLSGGATAGRATTYLYSATLVELPRGNLQSFRSCCIYILQ